MKKKLLLLVFAFMSFATALKAQVTFTCYYREYCDWNSYTEKFVNCKGYDEASMFVMNEKETMFTHTNENMKSTYYVDSKEYDSKNDVYTYEVTSDVGNKYYYVFDPKNKEIRALYVKDGETVMIRFYVKAMF